MAPGGYLAPSLKVISDATMKASNDRMIAPKYSIAVINEGRALQFESRDEFIRIPPQEMQ